MTVQYKLYQKRLSEVEEEISMYKERKLVSKSRNAVFFDDAGVFDFNAELESLEEKRQILIHSLDRCQSVMNGEGVIELSVFGTILMFLSDVRAGEGSYW